MGCALSRYERLSLWHETSGTDWAPRAALPGDATADVAIVGAGYTGLWTAHYLAAADPGLRIVVVDAEVAGYGASGRNGGWCSALFPASMATLAGLAGREAALAQHQAMRASVDEVVDAAAREGIDADITKGGTIDLARTEAQWARAQADVADARTWDRGEDELALLDRAATDSLLRARGTLGATYTPDCAVVHPAKLVRGLADAAERHGVTIHELTRVRAIAPHTVHTERGTVRADIVVRATEGYTSSLAGHRRTLAPVHSLVVATAPLPAAQWDEIGLRRRETFTDHRHLIVYGQRTADDRLVFGGRGAPYRYGSKILTDFGGQAAVFEHLRAAVVDLFPSLHDVEITHRWGGALGIARDWCASVELDRASGLAWAGGYVGDGVSTANLAGRTLTDLILARETALTGLPWVGHRSRSWEPEPLRWTGVNLGLRAAVAADAEERLTRRPSLVARVLNRVLH
ncbi:MAG: dependent oxidoreductase [Nocardioides sp.]|jgi:glycine/D-amino acid oxidase-like deaminating enzyme|uniref:NAD(P)/FAD-dependent oxidoreductase n=1 Tax=Nocardioides sp. TaxID=35761 RepID=UPI00262459FD|nr:FAD-binding oxidoreductase [Nocardioides sp.]MCW2834762.1 dependent oxidoreductase [Nocardioides sp.]